MYNKIANHRNIFQNYPTTVLNVSGSNLTFSDYKDGQFLMKYGSAVSGTVLSYGEMYVTASGDCDNTAYAWAQLTGSGCTIGENVGFSYAGDNTLQFTGSTFSGTHGHFLANANITFSSSVSSIVADFAFAASNVVDSASMSTQYFAGPVTTLTHWQHASLSSILTLTASQVVEIWARANSNTTFFIPSASFTVVQL